MHILRTIMVVTLIEARILARSWIFRFYIVFTFLGLVAANVALFIPYDTWSFVSPWMLRAVPSMVPYFNTLALTMVGCLFLMFGAVDSLRRDYSYDTIESIHTHDFTNVWYITGKALGVLLPYFIFHAVMLTLAGIVNAVFMNDVPVVLRAYLLYPLIITIPAYVFVTGLSFAVMSFIRHAAASIMLVLGMALVPFFVTAGLFARILDYNAIHLPLLYSDFVGFGNAGDILLHRGLFLLGGIGLIALASIRFTRLTQSVLSKKVTVICAAGTISIGVLFGVLFLGGKISDQHLRERMQALNEEYVNRPRARMTACSLDVTHHGSTLGIEAALTLTNHRNAPLDRICLSLNPGYTIDSITADNQSLDYTRDTQIIDIALPEPLGAGDSREITVSYHGIPDDQAMYPDIPSNEHLSLNRLFTHVIDKRHAFVTPDYILLSPGSLWYPVSGVPYGMVFPDAFEKDFTEFTLELSTSDDLTVISQGEVTGNGNGSFSVRPETKLTGLTLIAGEYEEQTKVIPGGKRPINAAGDMIQYDDLELALYIKPGHDYFTPYVAGHEETFWQDQPRQKLNVEDRNGPFPYARYIFVEVPVQFYTYNRFWGMPADTVQPQMNLLPERGCFLPALDLGKAYIRARENLISRGQAPTDSDIANAMMRDLSGIVFQVVMPFIPEVPRQRILPLFDNLDRAYVPEYPFQAQYATLLYSVESPAYPMISAVLERYLRGNYSAGLMSSSMDRKYTALTDNEIVSLALQRMPFQEYLASNDDTGMFDALLNLKTAHLFGDFHTLIEYWRLNQCIDDFFADHRFENVPFDALTAVIDSSFGIDTQAIIDRWSNQNELPCYMIGDIDVVEIISEEQPVYQSTVTITNTSPVRGVVDVYPMTGRDRATAYCIEGNQTIEISRVTDSSPSLIYINTVFSQNIPIGVSHWPTNKPRQVETEPFDGVRTLDYQPNRDQPGIIVVDNLDEGFEIIADTPSQPDDLRFGFGKYPENYVCIDLENPPSRWGKAVFTDAYGSQKTAYYTKAGSGSREVCWTADIPKPGWYDLEYNVFDIGGVGVNINARFIDDLSLRVLHADENNDIAYTPEETYGWQYVSSFELDPGPVKVYLSNESDGTLICADAIRWVKK